MRLILHRLVFRLLHEFPQIFRILLCRSRLGRGPAEIRVVALGARHNAAGRMRLCQLSQRPVHPRPARRQRLSGAFASLTQFAHSLMQEKYNRATTKRGRTQWEEAGVTHLTASTASSQLAGTFEARKLAAMRMSGHS